MADERDHGNGLGGFSKHIKDWSVGKILVFLILLAWVINLLSVDFSASTFGVLLIVGVLVEAFELSNNKLAVVQNNFARFMYGLCMILSLLSIVGIGAGYFLQLLEF